MISTIAVTVVVPTRDSARTIEACLASIRAQDHAIVELVVVDDSSIDDTVAIAGRYAHRVETIGAERSVQLNHGSQVGGGEIVMFVDSDMVLERNVISESVAILGADPSVGAVVVDELAFGEGWLARCRELERRLCLGDASVGTARVFRRDAFEAVDGYNEVLDACEDRDLADRVSSLGWRTGRTDAVIHHDEGRPSLVVAFGEKRSSGRGGGPRLARPPAELRRRRPASLLRGILHSSAPLRDRAGLVLLKSVEAAGFALGAASAGRPRQSRSRAAAHPRLEPTTAARHSGPIHHPRRRR